MKFHCTYCGHKIETGYENLGQSLSCPNCAAEVQVPHQQAIKISDQPQPSSARSASQSTQSNVYRRIFLNSLLACLIFGALTAIYSLFTSSFGATQGTILLTTASFGVYSLTGLGCATVIDHPQYHGLGRVGITISMIGGLWAFVTNVAFMSNLGEFGGGEVLQLRFSFLVIAAAFAHSALLLRINTADPTVQSVRYLTLGIITTFTVVLVSNIMAPENFPQAWRLFSVLAVLNVLGTLATPLLHAATKEAK